MSGCWTVSVSCCWPVSIISSEGVHQAHTESRQSDRAICPSHSYPSLSRMYVGPSSLVLSISDVIFLATILLVCLVTWFILCGAVKNGLIPFPVQSHRSGTGGNMGSFSVWHWLIVLCVIGIPAVIVGLIIWFVSRASKKRQVEPAEDRLGELRR